MTRPILDHLTEADRRDIVAAANVLADAARTATLAHFRSDGLSAETKEAERFDPVTVADRAAEVAMRELLSRLRPDDGILGEEFGILPGTSGLTWVLDPIDGTRGYLSGTPTWGVLIGLYYEGAPLIGIMDQPYLDERYRGRGDYIDGEVIDVIDSSPVAVQR